MVADFATLSRLLVKKFRALAALAVGIQTAASTIVGALFVVFGAGLYLHATWVEFSYDRINAFAVEALFENRPGHSKSNLVLEWTNKAGIQQKSKSISVDEELASVAQKSIKSSKPMNFDIYISSREPAPNPIIAAWVKKDKSAGFWFILGGLALVAVGKVIYSKLRV